MTALFIFVVLSPHRSHERADKAAWLLDQGEHDPAEFYLK